MQFQESKYWYIITDVSGHQRSSGCTSNIVEMFALAESMCECFLCWWNPRMRSLEVTKIYELSGEIKFDKDETRIN